MTKERNKTQKRTASSEKLAVGQDLLTTGQYKCEGQILIRRGERACTFPHQAGKGNQGKQMVFGRGGGKKEKGRNKGGDRKRQASRFYHANTDEKKKNRGKRHESGNSGKKSGLWVWARKGESNPLQ